RLVRRVEALKVVERTLVNCKRLHHPELLQIESPLLRLRVQLHLEVARCEVQLDFLAKASVHTTKAMSLDYGANDRDNLEPQGLLEGEWDENGKTFHHNIAQDGVQLEKNGEDTKLEEARKEALNDAIRPMDRFVVPLARFLHLKSSTYTEPEGGEEKAILLIDQAKEAGSSGLCKTLLEQAAQQLEKAEREEAPDVRAGIDRGLTDDDGSIATNSVHSQQDGEARRKRIEEAAAVLADPADDKSGAGTAPAPELPSPALKRRTRLWSALLELAWNEREELKDQHLARRAAVAVLTGGEWSEKANCELVAMQVR
ncbi:unnamed protein product, partial [Choristocarpus tenellus]